MLEPFPDLSTAAGWLPLAFMLVMGLAILAYVILDGFDLGVGLLLQLGNDDGQKDTMIASIGPFWDANETWLVLGIGILLVAFPAAHGIMLGALLFGFVNALVLELKTQDIIPRDLSNLASMAPAIITILALVFVARRFRAPSALTKPFTRGK